jgi:hypothetical protein
MFYFRKAIASHVVLLLLVVGTSLISGCIKSDNEKDEPSIDQTTSELNTETSIDQISSTGVQEGQIDGNQVSESQDPAGKTPDLGPDIDSESLLDSRPVADVNNSDTEFTADNEFTADKEFQKQPNPAQYISPVTSYSPPVKSWSPGDPISQVSPAQLSTMGAYEIQSIPPRDISNMSIDQFRAICSPLTHEQIGAITHEQFSVYYLFKDKFFSLESGLQYLPPRVISSLTTKQISRFPLWSLFYFSEDQLEAINSWSDDQLMSLDNYRIGQPERDRLKNVSELLHEIILKIYIIQLKYKEFIGNPFLERQYFSCLTPSQISELPISFIEMIDDEFFGFYLSDEQLSALTEEQLNAFPKMTRDVLNIPWQPGDPVSRLSPAQLSRMRKEELQLIPPQDISKMSIEQFRSIFILYLTKDQMGAMTYEQFNSRLEELQKFYFYRLFELSPRVISQFTAEQARLFSIGLLISLSNEQLEAIDSWSDSHLMALNYKKIFKDEEEFLKKAPEVFHNIIYKIYILLVKHGRIEESFNLEINYFPDLAPSQISKLPLHLIREVSSTSFVRLLSWDQLSAFTREQLNSFQSPIREEIFERLYGRKQSGPKPSESKSHSGSKSDKPKFKSEPRETPQKIAICEFLGIDPKSSTFESIKKEYKKFALKHHPDKAPGSENEEKMKIMNALFDDYKDHIDS